MEARLRKTPGRTYYESSIADFVALASPNDLVEFIAQSDEGSDDAHLILQKGAWANQIKILQDYLKDKHGYIIFEFSLSRLNMRIDVVLLMDDVVYSLEFKNNETRFEPNDIEQADGYGYALKNFYEVNRDKYVVPMLIATKAPDKDCSDGADLGIDKLFTLFKANTKKMMQYIDQIRKNYGSEVIYTQEDFDKWVKAPFKPNPTIIQSARSIYMNNKVDEFFLFDAGQENLEITEKTVESIVKEARDEKKKIICFVSGVPGAGKTLVGLDLAGKSRNNPDSGMPETVFFSGNGPLINVLTEALGRDAFKLRPDKFPNKNRAVNDVKTFIQDLHAFKQDIIATGKKDVSENVLIFDEAQRVWDSEKLLEWLKKKDADKSFYGLSEADLLLSVFDDKDWGVIVALVGLGQDIYRGEDGLSVWFNSLLANHPDWEIRLSKEIFEQKADDLSDFKEALFSCPRVKENPGLYLKTCIRTPRAQNLSEFAEALLKNQPEQAKAALEKFDSYPIFITRSYDKAYAFVKENTLRKERCGKLCSSNGKLLARYSHRFQNIDKWHFADWMLDEGGGDSSNGLVYSASEFDIQGLEIDWSLLGWDADMYYHEGKWHEQRIQTPSRFRVSTEEVKQHILNAYRVLLTRARKGLVIYIPNSGEYKNPYDVEKYYDSTYNYLKSCGIKDLDEAGDSGSRVVDAITLPF